MPSEAPQDVSPTERAEVAWRLARARARLQAEHLAALVGVGVLDTPPKPHFDDPAQQARTHFKEPADFISPADCVGQWSEAPIGMAGTAETARERAFCEQAIRQPAVLIMSSGCTDPCFLNKPLVTAEPAIRIYASATLEPASDRRPDTVCLITTTPRVGFGADYRAEPEALARDANSAAPARCKA